MFELEPISTSDLIQILTFSGAIAALAIAASQLSKQSAVAKAQFLRDSFEMLWKTYDPIGSEQIADFEKYPTELVLPEIYEARYKGKAEAIHRYIKMSKLYEYLVFAYSVKDVHNSTPMDEQWLRNWIAELKLEQEFKDVHESFKVYYPSFAKFFETIPVRK